VYLSLHHYLHNFIYHFLISYLIMDELTIVSMPNTGTSGAANSPAKKTKRSNTPNDDINLAALSVRVANKWASYPTVTLSHLAQADFLTKATQFDALIQQRILEQQARPTTTRTTRELTAEIKVGLKIVRSYLFEKYKDNAKAKQFYPDFGLEKKGNVWVFPTDQQRVLTALKTIKTGLITHGLGTKSCGTTYWTNLETNYNATVQAAIANDGASSNTVSQKELLKKEIKAAMTSLRFAIRANYPDTFNGVLRDFGFQKEKA
jgi:hypothetical protein